MINARPPLTLRSVELRRIQLPLVTPFRTAFGVEKLRDVLLVRVRGDGIEGWGECVAGEAPLYSPEYADGAQAVLAEHLVPRLAGLPGVRAHLVGPALAPVKGHQMAKSALEMAVLDAELRAAGMPLGAYLGATRDTVDCGVVVGIADSVGALLDAVESYLEQGYRRVKLKIRPGWDLEPVRSVREGLGGELALQVDANGAYTVGDARHLARLDEFDLLMLEQPLPADDLRGHARLAGLLATPVCLDESVTSARAAADAIALGACSIVCVKPGRVGGYLEARRVHDVCAASGVPVWCGGMLETGLGRGANLALAALPGFTLPADLSASDRYYETDLTDPFVLDDGRLRVPTGPGIGTTPRLDRLEELTVSVQEVSLG